MKFPPYEDFDSASHVTQLVPSTSRAAAFAWLALVRGLGLLIAGAVLGLAYDHSITLVIYLILGANITGVSGGRCTLR